MRTSRAVAALVVVTCALTANPSAMTVEEILARHAEARGGAARWRSLRSLVISGELTAFSEPSPFRLWWSAPDRYRFEATVLGEQLVLGHDGETAWWINPPLGAASARPAPAVEAAILRRDAEFPGPLLAPPDAGHRIRLAGTEEFEGTAALRMEVRMADGAEETWILDAHTFLPIARRSPASDYGTEMEGWTYYSDYRAVDGLVLPFRAEREYGTRHEVRALQEVLVDGPVEPERFRIPPPQGMGTLLGLAGVWDVKVESRPAPNAPWSASEAVAEVRTGLGGRMLEARMTYQDQGTAVEQVCSISYDSFAKVHRLGCIDDVTGHLNVLEGSLADGQLVASNVKTGTALVLFGQTFHQRLTLRDITAEGFVLDAEISADGGERWFANQRFTHTRRRGAEIAPGS